MTGDVSGDQSAAPDAAAGAARDPYLGASPAAPGETPQPFLPPAAYPAQAHPPPGYAAPGYAPPPPPGYAPVQPSGYGYPAPPQPPPSTDGFAIAALVFGIIGGILFAVIFGLVALSRIKKSEGRKTGRGLAIAGLVLSGIWIAVIAVVIVVGLASAASRDPVTGTVVDGGRVSVEDVAVGDCLAEVLGEGDLRTVKVVPCTEPHHGEAFATFILPAGEYPGEDAVTKAAEDGCSNRVPSDLDEDLAQQLTLFYLYPKKSNWVLGDRNVTCIASSTEALTQPIVP